MVMEFVRLELLVVYIVIDFNFITIDFKRGDGDG